MVIAAALAAALVGGDGTPSSLPLAHAAPASRVVAVLYFDNNTGDARYNVLQKGLADMLVTDLSGVSSLEVVEREKLEQVVGELDRQNSRYFDPKTAQKIGRLIGARYAVTGAFAAIAPRMRIDIRLIEVATARVVMADKVVGNQDSLFELEEALVKKFVRGLNLRDQKVATDTGVTDVKTLLRYSEGIDLADKGDLENASQKLGKLVRSAPRFTLAQKKYADILRRLRLAKKQRERGLSENETVLLKNIEQALKQNLTSLDADGAKRYFAYRVARGNYALWKLRTVAGLDPDSGDSTWLPPAKHDPMRRHQEQFFDNTMRFIREMEAHRKRKNSRGRPLRVEMELPREDRQRGKELGIADDIGDWTFAQPHAAKRALAEFVLIGKTPFWLDQRSFRVSPTLGQLSPRHAKQALALFEQALKDIKAEETGEALQRGVADITDSHAEGLLALGRREQAIAVWQEFLETYPKSTKYAEFETKIEALLGISDKALIFARALKDCSNQLMGMLYEEVERLARAQGPAGMRALVDDIEKRCVRGPIGPAFAVQAYFHTARTAAARGHCDLYRDMRARADKLGPNYASTMDQIQTSCPR